jgi:hypothetical protein
VNAAAIYAYQHGARLTAEQVHRADMLALATALVVAVVLGFAIWLSNR